MIIDQSTSINCFGLYSNKRTIIKSYNFTLSSNFHIFSYGNRRRCTEHCDVRLRFKIVALSVLLALSAGLCVVLSIGYCLISALYRIYYQPQQSAVCIITTLQIIFRNRMQLLSLCPESSWPIINTSFKHELQTIL